MFNLENVTGLRKVLAYCLTDCGPADWCSPDDECSPDRECNPDN